MEKMVYVAFGMERVIGRYNSLEQCYNNQINGFIWGEEVRGVDIYRINENEEDDFLYFLDLAYTQVDYWNDEDNVNWEKYKLYRFYENEVKKIQNYTPHDINIIKKFETLTFKSQGVARVSTKSVKIDNVDYVDIYKTEYGEVEGLPKEIDGVHYIVSMLVKQACPNRKDLLSPSQLVRNDKGQIIGYLGLE